MRTLLLVLALAGCSTAPLSAPNPNTHPIYVVSAFCNERCRWLPTGLHSDSAVFTNTDNALNQARTWATQSGVSDVAINIMLSYWDAGQDMDVEFSLDDGKNLDMLLYTDEVRP